MLKKTITYTDYDGTERTEDFFFNLSKAELMDMELSTPGGFKDRLLKIVKARDTVLIMQAFKDLIFESYGVKSEDGKRFIKSKELTDAFAQTEAYSQLYMELMTDLDAASEFITGIMPSDMVQSSGIDVKDIEGKSLNEVIAMVDDSNNPDNNS